MPGRLVIAALLLAGPAAGRDLSAGLAECRALSQDGARLACFDRLAHPGDVVEFHGAGSRITPQFAITRPSRMTFISADVVMVIYLLDEGGKVVQNFHQAGAGQGTFLIERPGTYSLQINATGGWRVEVEAA